MLAKFVVMGYFHLMIHLDEFLDAEDRLYENPAEVVALAASALLAISFLHGTEPVRRKKGLPVFKHQIPLEGYNVAMSVKPQPSHFLHLERPEDRVYAAGLPASLGYSYRYYHNTTFSFERSSDVVAVELTETGYSSVTEQGRNTIRNIWQPLHDPTIAYVKQAAEQLG